MENGLKRRHPTPQTAGIRPNPLTAHTPQSYRPAIGPAIPSKTGSAVPSKSRSEHRFRAVNAFQPAPAGTGMSGQMPRRGMDTSYSRKSWRGRPAGSRLSAEKEVEMANTKSAKKAARQMVSRTAINKNRRSAVKSEVRKVEEAIASGNKDAAATALKSAQPALVRTAQKGVMHPKTASRKVSRLSQRIKAMA
jgi:small subunit ribosomal protein S20